MIKFKKFVTKSLGVLSIASSAFLTGCASYNAATLNDLVLYTPTSNDEVVIASKVFSKADCKKYLDRNLQHDYTLFPIRRL